MIDERRSGERGTIDRGSKHVLINRYYNGWIICDVAASDGAIAWSADHGRLIKTRAEIQGVITVVMRSGGAHPDRPIAIQGAKVERFYNAHRAINLGPPSAIQRSRHFPKTVHHGPLS